MLAWCAPCLQICNAVLDTTTLALLCRGPITLGYLEFSDCSWPLPAQEYAKLGYSVARTLHSLTMRRDGHTLAIAQQLCEGAAQRRSEAGVTGRLWVRSNKAMGRMQFGESVQLCP